MESIDCWPSARQQAPKGQQNISVFTNLYEIRIDRLPNQYYLYLPNPADLTTIYKYDKHLRQYRSDPAHFYHRIGYLSRFREGFLGTKKVEQALTIQRIEGNVPNSFSEVLLASPVEVNMEDIIAEEGGSPVLRSLLTTFFKRNAGKKAPNTKIYTFDTFEFKATVLNKLTLTYFNRKLWLSTDTRQKINENCTLLHYLLKYSPNEASQLLKNVKLIKNYGDRGSFYLSSIDYSQKPTSKLAGSQETYEQYYLRRYEIQINNLSQPLIVARRNCYQKQTNDHPHIVLIPELVAVEGRSYRPDYPKQIERKLRSLKQLTPSVKESNITDLVSSLAAQDVIKKSALKLEATSLFHPKILLNGSEIEPEDGVFEFRNKIMSSPELRSWAIAYSVKQGGDDKEEADQLIGYFRNLTRIYGINIVSNPSEITISSATFPAWKSALQQNFKTFGKLQIVLLLLKEEEQGFYGDLKQLLTLKLNCVSQVIKKSTIFGSKSKKPYSIATDVLIQMISKVGAVPWGVSSSKTQLSSTLIMQGGLNLTLANDSYSLSFVGFTNKDNSQSYSFFKNGIKNKEGLKLIYDSVFISWAKRFVLAHRQPAQTIILFREESLSVSTKEYIDIQISSLETLIKRIGQKIKKTNYAPRLVYILVNRQQEVEFYSRQDNSTNSIALKNIPCGTVLFEQPQESREFRFYLTSHYNHYGTAKPVSFKVRSSEKIDKQEIAQLTYEQCYNYFNYQGSICVPAALQYASKLKQHTYNFKGALQMENKLSNFPYYL